MSRGIERRRIYDDERDYVHFLALMSERYAVHAYALMTNHYHLIIQTPKRKQGDAMAQYIIRGVVCATSGQGRYSKAVLRVC